MWFDGIKLTKNQFKFDNMLFSTSKPETNNRTRILQLFKQGMEYGFFINSKSKANGIVHHANQMKNLYMFYRKRKNFLNLKCLNQQ